MYEHDISEKCTQRLDLSENIQLPRVLRGGGAVETLQLYF